MHFTVHLFAHRLWRTSQRSSTGTRPETPSRYFDSADNNVIGEIRRAISQRQLLLFHRASSCPGHFFASSVLAFFFHGRRTKGNRSAAHISGSVRLVYPQLFRPKNATSQTTRLIILIFRPLSTPNVKRAGLFLLFYHDRIRFDQSALWSALEHRLREPSGRFEISFFFFFRLLVAERAFIRSSFYRVI